jgi:hypothetical protein
LQLTSHKVSYNVIVLLCNGKIIQWVLNFLSVLIIVLRDTKQVLIIVNSDVM